MFWCRSAFSSSSVCIELISISFLLPSFSGQIEIHFLGWSRFIKVVLLRFSSPVKWKDNTRMGERPFFCFSLQHSGSVSHFQNWYFQQCAQGAGVKLSCEYRTLSTGFLWLCSSSEILDDRVHASVEGSHTSSLGGGPWVAVQWKQCTDTVLLFAVSKDCLFLLKSETDQIIRFYQSCFLLYRKSENMLNML